MTSIDAVTLENMERRFRKACLDFIDAVERKHALKLHYRSKAEGGSAADLVTAMGQMSGDMRYKIAKDDWLDAMAEMNATGTAITALRSMLKAPIR